MDKQDSKIQQFNYESFEEKENIIQILKALQDGFQKKNITLKNEIREIALHPQGLITTSLIVKSQDGKNKVTIQFKWKENS